MHKPKTLTLEFDPADAARLQELPSLCALAPGRPVTRHLARVLFDTPDRQLAGQNVMLEVHKTGSRTVQTVRAEGSPGAAGPLSREWRNPLPSPDPDPAAIADMDLRRLVTPLPGTALEPVAREDVRRTSRRLVIDEANQVMVAVDTGTIEAGEVARPVAEIELRAEGDDAAALYDLALAIQHEIPVRVATVPRSLRTRRMLAGEAAAWRKAGLLDLPAGATVEAALETILHHCLDHLSANERCTLEDDHPEGVHQMRVSMRRLRSALRIFRMVIPPEQYEAIGAEVKWLTQSLADARDLDVFTEEIVGPVAAAFPGEPAFAVLKARLAADRAAAREAARAAVASPRFTRFLLEAGAWIARRAWRDQPVSEQASYLFHPITELSDQLIAKRFRKVRKAGRRFAELNPEARHQLRIDVKRLRYAIDFFASLYGRKRVAVFVKALQRLQDGLGYMNDVTVAKALLTRIAASAPEELGPAIRHASALVLGWHSHAATEADGQLAGEVADLLASRRFWSAPAKDGTV